MYYVYVLQSLKDKKFYIGYTSDLRTRLDRHNKGRVESTKNRTPFKLIHYEAFLNKNDALIREKWLKTGWGKNQIETMLKNYLGLVVKNHSPRNFAENA
jgi:putative endonuclease